MSGPAGSGAPAGVCAEPGCGTGVAPQARRCPPHARERRQALRVGYDAAYARRQRALAQQASSPRPDGTGGVALPRQVADRLRGAAKDLRDAVDEYAAAEKRLYFTVANKDRTPLDLSDPRFAEETEQLVSDAKAAFGRAHRTLRSAAARAAVELDAAVGT